MNKIKNFELELIDFNDFVSKNEEKFDFIVTNPPYVENGFREQSMKELKFEDDRALYSGEDGLDLIRVIIEKLDLILKEKGFIVIEIGVGQVDKLTEICVKLKKKFFFEEDCFGNLRFLVIFNC